MTLTQWYPIAERVDSRQALARIFGEAYWPSDGPRAREAGPRWATDIRETADAFVVKVAMPGVMPEDVSVSVLENTLTIQGESRSEPPPKEEHYYQREHRFGRFSRSFTLPAAVQSDKADAALEHGILTLTLPKAQEAKAKQIPVRVAGAKRVIEGAAASKTRGAPPTPTSGQAG
jgi:HSP20 family protein